MFSSICETIKRTINSEQIRGNAKRISIGFMTYSNKVQYYTLSASSSKPKIYEVADVNDTLLPVDEGKFMNNLHDSFDAINDFLDLLPSIHKADSASTENALSTALA